MKKIFTILLFSLFSLSCHAQKTDLPWKDFYSNEAGIRALFPCDPKKSFKSFQDEPRPIHVYEFSCEVEELRFLISSKNYLDEFNQDTFRQTFDSNEFILKTMFGEVERFNEKKDFLTNGLTSRFYEVKLKSGGQVNSLVILSEYRSYEMLIGIKPEYAKNTNFDEVSQNFINSVQILDK